MSLFSKLSQISRSRKMELLEQRFQPTPQMKILDVGAQISWTDNPSRQLIDDYPWKENITALNISQTYVNEIKSRYPQVEAVVGDACNLPWPDKHFDLVYSNAVIEHVGTRENQRKMAREIMRVGKQWFVTTPNRWYPFEFHMRLPLVTWLPFHGYLTAGKIICYDHSKKCYGKGYKRDDLRLLSYRELKSFFPDSRIIKQRVTFMPETLIVIGPVSK